ncbi:MAG: hypothetical protein HY074_00500, partial [Deltaproteobacteria bacterium]|nr:hypothetical protein [Deltaproteobacteria bacterium]
MRSLWQFLRDLRRCLSLRRKIRRISHSDSKSGHIVFNTVSYYNFDAFIGENYCAYLLACCGYTVTMLIDDFQMAQGEIIQVTHGPDDYRKYNSFKNRLYRAVYILMIRGVFRHPRIKVTRYSRLLQKAGPKLELTKADQRHVDASVLRYFQSAKVDLNDAGEKKYHDATTENARISKTIGRYVASQLNPDLFFTTHGIYASWGPAYDQLREHAIPCLIYGWGSYLWPTVHVTNTSFFYMSESDLWLEFQGRKLGEAELLRLDDYFAKRFGGKAIDTSMYLRGVDADAHVEIDTSPAGHVIGMFPNVIWDANLPERNIVFENAVDWIVKTIRFVETRPELHLIVRYHPSEATLMSYAKKMGPLVEARIPNLASIKNVTILPSNAKVRTYTLLKDYVDIGLVYESMLGLELPYLGIPVLTVAKSRYRGVGNSFEPRNEEEYFRLLGQPEKLLSDFKAGTFRERAIFYAYFYLFESAWPLPIFDEKRYSQVNFEVDVKELDPAFNQKITK